jgi:hypothetical protein
MSISAAQKLQVVSEALHGRVFDILGEVFEENSLKDMLLEAIRYGDQPEVRARLNQSASTTPRPRAPDDHPQPHALAQESLSAERLFAVKGRDGERPKPVAFSPTLSAPSS